LDPGIDDANHLVNGYQTVTPSIAMFRKQHAPSGED
jgi:hypothetical protein